MHACTVCVCVYVCVCVCVCVQDPEREMIARELLSSPLLATLLQDAYGNYVIQSALSVSSGTVHQELVEAIRPHIPALRGTPHGKRILQRIGAK